MLEIAVCEDEQADRDNLIGILKPLLDKYEEEYRITNFTSGGELLQSDDSFHLIFMDIIMEGRNGIETGWEFYSQNHSAKIIYTTDNRTLMDLMEKVMGTGIIVCGLNGAGKSTLGKALAEKLDFYFIDNEDLYFPKIDFNYIYSFPRTHEEVEKLLFNEIKAHENFVFASVKGDYGEAIYPFFKYIVLIDVPKDIRIQRVKNRSFQKFGNRMLVGGDLYEQEERFFELVKSRPENTVKEWVQCLRCPIVRIDGTKPIEENIDFIIKQMRN